MLIHIEIDHIFPVPLERAFSFITDVANWPDYWPDFIRLEEIGDIKWGNEGAMVRVVIWLLNRETVMNIKLKSFVQNERVRYVSRQKGLPDIHHERHFRETPEGSSFRLVMTYQPRKGLAGVFDRFVLKKSIVRAVRKNLNNLDRLLAAHTLT